MHMPHEDWLPPFELRPESHHATLQLSLLISDRAWKPVTETHVASSNNQQTLFLCLSFVLHGGRVRETFVSAE